MLRYHNITKDDMLNGEGLRVVLWLSGCEHGCSGCHNPETWDKESGAPFDANAKKELFAQLEKDYIHGITFSGGDPLLPDNRRDLQALCAELRQWFPTKTQWLYTGYTWDEIQDYDGLQFLDVIVDGKFDETRKERDLHWYGSANQRLIDVPLSMDRQEVVLKEL